MRRLFPIALLLTLLCTGCGAASARPAAEPPVLAGTFAGPGGTLTFSSDGISVTMALTGSFAAATGLPEGETAGQYAYTWPEGERSREFDRASHFSLTAGGVTVTFANDAAATDGDTIAFLLPDGESVAFKRQ
ncbi:MAG: hypothetical protein IJQ17_08740 [Oscillospiraceae bacterium]|nr:hypothetical protein [Oscillospiraceae bacterium]